MKKNYQILRTKKEIEDLVSLLLRYDYFCHDFETTSLETHSDTIEIVGCGFAVNPEEIYFVPFNYAPMGLSPQEIIELLREPIENENIGKIGQNLKYEYRVWNRFGVNLQNIHMDTMVASYCLFTDKFSHALDEMTLRHFGHIKIRTAHVIAATVEEPITEPEYIIDAKGKKKKVKKKKIKKSDKTMKDSPLEVVAEYCCEDIEWTFKLANYYQYLFSKPENEKAYLNYRTLEKPLISVLAKMECDGVSLDIPYLASLKESILDSIETIKKRVDLVAGFELSITKSAQIAEVIYSKLDLFNKNNIIPKKTKSGKLATNEKVLSKIEHEPFVKDILGIKKLNKLVTTYLKPLPAKVSLYTNKLHCNFLQHITSTTRLASSNPNLQNIPKRTEEGRRIRGAFTSRFPGGLIGSFDYSQQELRILAHLCKEPILVETYKRNGDAHKAAASLVYRIPESEVSDQQRYLTKTIQYAILYGATEDRIAAEAGITLDEAKQLVSDYMSRMTHVSGFMEATYEELRKYGYIETIFGTRRYMPKIYSLLKFQREAAKREAFNMKMQGTAAGQMKKAMLSISKFLREHKTLMIIQVHDELVLDFHPDEFHLAEEIKNLMQDAVKLDVPMLTDGKLAENWLLAH